MARLLIISGLALAAIGLALHFAPQLFAWMGKLPGDIRFGSGKTRVFIPITTMIVISVVLTVLVNIFRR